MRRKLLWIILGIAFGLILFMLIGQKGYTPQRPAEEHYRGSPDAPNTIIEFSDFQCPACARAHPEVESLLNERGDVVKFVYKHFPLTSIHPRAFKAAEASECAADQGKFWEFYDELFTKRGFSDSDFKSYAMSIGLDVKSFMQCLESGVMASRVDADIKEAQALNVRATPTFFINGERKQGVQSADAMIDALEMK